MSCLNRSSIRYFWTFLSVCCVFQGKDDFLGRCSLTPVIRLHGHQIPEPSLEWVQIYLGSKRAGEILAVCELFLVCFIKFSHDPIYYI